MINLHFKDYAEMKNFAYTLLKGEVSEEKQKEKVNGKKVEKKEVIEEEPKVKEAVKQTPLTIEDVRALFVEKNNVKGNTAKLKAILTEFGVKKVTDLEEKDFNPVMAKLKEL